MIEEIIQGLAGALVGAFGPEYDVFIQDIKQGLTRPCFFIEVGKVEIEPLLGLRYLMTVPLVLHYFPRDPGNNAEMWDAAFQMGQAVRFITLPDGSLLHSAPPYWEITDDTLHFAIAYTLSLREEQAITLMETLSLDSGVSSK